MSDSTVVEVPHVPPAICPEWCSPLTPCLNCRPGPIIPEDWQPTEVKPFPDPIPHIIPFGTVTIVAGAAGVGKTAMLAGCIRRWLDGKTIWGHPTNRPTRFYYLAADRQWASHQLWFDAVGYPEIAHYSVADDLTINPEWLRQPQNAMKVFQKGLDFLNPVPGSHLIVDPVSPLFISGDQNKPRDVAATMIQFSRFARRYQINITCCAHFSKQKPDAQTQYRRYVDRISGSGAFVGFTDTQLYLIDPEPPEQPYHVFGWRPRHAPEETFKVVRDDQGLFVPYREDANQEVGLLSLLPEGRSMSVSDLIDAAFEVLGMSQATVYRRLKDFQDAGRVERQHGRVVKVSGAAPLEGAGPLAVGPEGVQ